MVCKCGSTGVKNTVLGKEFYYCRTCKDEIALSSPTLSIKEYGYSIPYESFTLPPEFVSYSPNTSTTTQLGPFDPGTYDVMKGLGGVWTATPLAPGQPWSICTYSLARRGYFEITPTGAVFVRYATNGGNP